MGSRAKPLSGFCDNKQKNRNVISNYTHGELCMMANKGCCEKTRFKSGRSPSPYEKDTAIFEH